MKKSTMILILVLVLTSSLHAVMGLNGGIFPNSYTDQNNADPFDMDNQSEYFIIGRLNQDLTITFQVDMSVQIFNGWFIPGVDTSAVSGSMNSWAKWQLEDTDGDNIYTGEYSFYGSISDVIEYKFRINDNFELYELPNRNFTIDDTITTIPVVFYDDFNPNPPTNLTATVNGTDVALDWDAPATRDVQYYNLYREDSIFALVYHPTTSYTETSVPFGSHVYYATAMYPEGESGPSNMITVNIINNPPVADAGPDQTVNEGAFVQLDGSGSYDPEGLALTYLWTAPAEITLDDPTIVDPSFTAPWVTQDEVFPIELIVYDGDSWSAPDTVFITVHELMDSGEEQQNLETALNASYPNPFNSSTTISFSLKDNSHVEIVIYNVKGERVSTIMNENRDSGIHTFRWDGTDLSAGIYFVKLKVDDKVSDIQKTIILR